MSEQYPTDNDQTTTDEAKEQVKETGSKFKAHMKEWGGVYVIIGGSLLATGALVYVAIKPQNDFLAAATRAVTNNSEAYVKMMTTETARIASKTKIV